MRNAVRLLLLTLLYLAGAQELCASIPKTRVRNFFPLAANPCPEVALQVPELRLDNPLLYGESVSGDTFWTKFDPEGLAEVTPEQAKALYQAHEKEIDAGINGQNFVMRGIASLFGTRELFHHMNKLSYEAALKTGNNRVSTGEQALQITAAGVDNYMRGLTIASVVAAPAGMVGGPKAPGAAPKISEPAPPENPGGVEPSAKGTHKATMTVLNSEGDAIHTEELVGGGTGKAKPTFPEQGAVHTEAKGTAQVREMVNNGTDVGGVLIEGERPPCNMCKGEMNKLHRETGVPTTYVDGQGATWESSAGKRPPPESR